MLLRGIIIANLINIMVVFWELVILTSNISISTVQDTNQFMLERSTCDNYTMGQNKIKDFYCNVNNLSNISENVSPLYVFGDYVLVLYHFVNLFIMGGGISELLGKLSPLLIIPIQVVYTAFQIGGIFVLISNRYM